jgi:hypothetical protein
MVGSSTTFVSTLFEVSIQNLEKIPCEHGLVELLKVASGALARTRRRVAPHGSRPTTPPRRPGPPLLPVSRVPEAGTIIMPTRRPSEIPLGARSSSCVAARRRPGRAPARHCH